MRLFRRNHPDDVPDWAGDLAAGDFQRFLQDVERAIRKHGVTPVINRDLGYWFPKDKPKQKLGLQNLVQTCAPVAPLEWPEIIDNHVRITLTVKHAEMPTDFETVRSQIKLRLYPLDVQVPAQTVEYPGCSEFKTLLAIDYPETVATVTQDIVDGWPVAKSQLYDLALENVWIQDKPEVRILGTEEGTELVQLRSPSFFTASHVLMLERHLDRPAPNGAVVIVPTRDNAFFHVIDSRKAAGEIARMISIASKFYADGPGSVTPSLLWWRAGKLSNLPYELGDRLNFFPPAEFEDMLETLI